MIFSGAGRTCRTLAMVVREGLAGGELPRQPEPEAMDDAASVAAFDREGSASGSMLPVYHFNALALSRMLPSGGRLLDLGSGSGRFLAYLARGRPDLEVVGLELSEAMVETGTRMLAQAGLGGRVRLERGDMTDFAGRFGGGFDAVSCIYALHHLPDGERVRACLREVAELRGRSGCGVWIFDHARPRSSRTARVFPEVFSPEAAPGFRRDSGNSLLASFSFAELSAWTDEFLGPGGHELARFLPLLQAHWLLPGRGAAEPAAGGGQWAGAELPAEAGRAFRQLAMVMGGVELGAAAAARRGAPAPSFSGGAL